MQMNRKIIGIALLFGIVIWIIDGVADYLFFYKGTLAGNLLSAIPPHELYFRFLMLVSFIILGLIIDTIISNYKRKHRGLSTAHDELDQIFNTVTDGLCVVTIDFKIRRFNRAFVELFEIDDRNKAPLSCSRITCIPLCDTPQCPVQQIQSGLTETVVTEFDLKRSNGQRTCELTISPLYNYSGKVIGAVCNYRDLTDLRQSIADHAKSEATLKTLLDAAPMGIGMVKNRIVGWTNGKFSQLTGYSHEELSGMSARQLYLSDEEYERVGREKHGDIFTHGTSMIVTKLKRKDGSVFDVLLSATSIDSSDLSGSTVFTVLDITEQKKLEEQLYHSQKMETLGQLAGGIAHDFNNLLTIIYGVSQIALLSIHETDQLYNDFKIIEQTAERAAALIRHLLAFSRHQMAEPRTINLNDGLREMDVLFRRLISENIRLVTSFDENLWPIRIDPMQVEQVLTNLVVNARDAMPDGGSLTIETSNIYLDEAYTDSHVDIAPGEYVMLAVTDTGIGMTDETLSHIFEPFYTTKKHTEGTGLGLSTCYGIIKQNNGAILVYSERGFGTTMKILLPRVSGDTTAFKLKTDRTDIPKGSETVLLAEDDENVRKTISRVLCDNGYSVIEAVDGETALRIVDEQPPGTIDILITDVVMPNIGGRELATVLTGSGDGMKLLYISGYTEQAIRNQGTPGGGFLQKPFTPAELLRKVREILDKVDAV